MAVADIVHANNEKERLKEQEESDNTNWMSFGMTPSQLFTVCQVLISIFYPPIAVFLERGCGVDLIINVLLCCIVWVPGVIHALVGDFCCNHITLPTDASSLPSLHQYIVLKYESAIDPTAKWHPGDDEKAGLRDIFVQSPLDLKYDDRRPWGYGKGYEDYKEKQEQKSSQGREKLNSAKPPPPSESDSESESNTDWTDSDLEAHRTSVPPTPPSKDKPDDSSKLPPSYDRLNRSLPAVDGTQNPFPQRGDGVGTQSSEDSDLTLSEDDDDEKVVKKPLRLSK
ncbi:hypothetical protein T439DRAFT_381704 [Meredithblackwellia eburnea MCA 4105]